MIRVLLVDDDALVRSGLSMVLGATDDIEVVGEAADGRAAIDAAAGLRPDVILMDIRMPRMDGIAATEQIAARPDAPRVLVLTTFQADEYVFSALQAGATGFLLKDTPPREIADAVRTVAAGDGLLSPAHIRALIDRFAGGQSRTTAATDRLAILSDREREVVGAVARGLTNAEIAAELHLSDATIKAHLAHIFTKLDTNRVQVAILGHDAGLDRPCLD